MRSMWYMEIMKKDNLKPHIEVAETGIVPEGRQRGLLLLYLEGKGIEPIQGATTYGCINKILKMDNLKVFDKKIVKKKILVKKNIFAYYSRKYRRTAPFSRRKCKLLQKKVL